MQSDNGHDKELWTACVPWPPPVHDWTFQIKPVDILNVLPCSQDRQPAVLLLFPRRAWLSNRLVAAGRAGR